MTGMGLEGWRSGESTCLPPLRPWFDSWIWRHMWVEFVVEVFLWVLRFSSLHENQHAKFQIDPENEGVRFVSSAVECHSH